MSDYSLQYIPIDPQFKPTNQAMIEAERLLAFLIPHAEVIRSELPGSVSFYHPGQNWSGVTCPICGADAEPWWSVAMDNSAAEHQFKSLSVTAACCASTVSLNELKYIWPAGFGSYMLEAINPNMSGLSGEQLDQLAKVLGCSVREIPVHI
jgi:hypothetical protein